jgi:hypothetical protein
MRQEMKYTYHFDEASGICTVHVTGKHRRPEDSMTLQQFARSFGDEHGCRRFLFDMTKAEIVGGTGDTFKTGTVPGDKNHKQTMQKISLVYSGDLADHKFMENVAVNRGYQLRVFDRLDKAIEWLK